MLINVIGNTISSFINQATSTLSTWILVFGIWNDGGVWIDTATWKDN